MSARYKIKTLWLDFHQRSTILKPDNTNVHLNEDWQREWHLTKTNVKKMCSNFFWKILMVWKIIFTFKFLGGPNSPALCSTEWSSRRLQSFDSTGLPSRWPRSRKSTFRVNMLLLKSKGQIYLMHDKVNSVSSNSFWKVSNLMPLKFNML